MNKLKSFGGVVNLLNFVGDNMESLRKMLEERYIERFEKFSADESGDRSGIRTSDILSPCLRRCYFNILSKTDNKYGVEIDLKTRNIFFLGHKYHEILISNMYIDKDGEPQLVDFDRHKIVFDEVDGVYKVLNGSKVIGIYGSEVPVSYKGMIRGRLDELWFDEEEGKVYIIDKKTVTRFPSDIPPHYRKQVSYYMVMLADTYPKLNVREGFLLYILNRTKYEFGVKCSDKFSVDVDSFTDELEGKIKSVKYYLDSDEYPPASPSEYECKYCWFKKHCDAYKKMSGIEYHVIGKK